MSKWQVEARATIVIQVEADTEKEAKSLAYGSDLHEWEVDHVERLGSSVLLVECDHPADLVDDSGDCTQCGDPATSE